mmetsp:Transcript_4334/g.11360  ORF Transcript_4334/g.11360 Transcript_4334/m.11360 type:complete len:274 (-) Transcript_4334:261-1082(-)
MSSPTRPNGQRMSLPPNSARERSANEMQARVGSIPVPPPLAAAVAAAALSPTRIDSPFPSKLHGVACCVVLDLHRAGPYSETRRVVVLVPCRNGHYLHLFVEGEHSAIPSLVAHGVVAVRCCASFIIASPFDLALRSERVSVGLVVLQMFLVGARTGVGEQISLLVCGMRCCTTIRHFAAGIRDGRNEGSGRRCRRSGVGGVFHDSDFACCGSSNIRDNWEGFCARIRVSVGARIHHRAHLRSGSGNHHVALVVFCRCYGCCRCSCLCVCVCC